MQHKISIIPLVALLIGCANNYPPLQTVSSVDVERYMGRWYEIARLPNRFEKDCFCVRAEYMLLADGTIKVVNSCRKDSVTGEEERIEGKAFVVEGSENAKLKVQFFWPFRGDYWILWLAEDYSVAMVGTPSRKYLWILSRTPSLSETQYEELLTFASKHNFDVSEIIRVSQSCQ